MIGKLQSICSIATKIYLDTKECDRNRVNQHVSQQIKKSPVEISFKSSNKNDLDLFQQRRFDSTYNKKIKASWYKI